MPRRTGDRHGKPQGVVVAASSDRYVPMAYEGVLEPNYYCRGWNSKRADSRAEGEAPLGKYCRLRAGASTKHTGIGRCNMHGGNNERFISAPDGSWIRVARPRLAELMAKHLENPTPLNVMPELARARALLEDWMDLYEEARESGASLKDLPDIGKAEALINTISNTSKRERDAQTSSAVSRLEVRDAMNKMGRVVLDILTDEIGDVPFRNRVLDRIHDGWQSV